LIEFWRKDIIRYIRISGVAEKRMISKHVDEKIIKELALMIAVNCVRNKITEEYQSSGKLSKEDINKFNTEVTNKIYTFLWYTFNGSQSEKDALLKIVKWSYPDEWDKPVMDDNIVKAVKQFLEQ
jgi:hypothetical protein